MFLILSSFCPHTLRGVSANIVYLEEAAYLDMGVFYQVVIPLLELKTTALIGISTPSDSTNFYSELTELKDEAGESIFNVLKEGMICDECLGKPNAEDCPHRLQDKPPWKSQEKTGIAKAIYGDKTSIMNRELMGMITDEQQAAFEPSWTRAFINRAPYVLRAIDRVEYLFSGLDPNAGGEGSDMTIVTAFYMNGCWMVSVRFIVCRGQSRESQTTWKHTWLRNY